MNSSVFRSVVKEIQHYLNSGKTSGLCCGYCITVTTTAAAAAIIYIVIPSTDDMRIHEYFMSSFCSTTFGNIVSIPIYTRQIGKQTL